MNTSAGQPASGTPAENHDRPAVLAFDPWVPSPARMYDYYLGGKDNFPADREAAEQALSVVPFGREVALANRQFLVRAVTFMARSGIGQFIDLVPGYPPSLMCTRLPGKSCRMPACFTSTTTPWSVPTPEPCSRQTTVWRRSRGISALLRSS